MSLKVNLFTQGLFGELIYKRLQSKQISAELYTYASDSVRRDSDSTFLREGYPYKYIHERKYDPAKITFTSNDIIICAEWTKDFFHDTPSSAPVYIIHPSLLPKYRGYGAVSEQFLNDVKISGVTLIKDSTDIDAGDIYLQEKITIDFNDYPQDFLNKCADIAVNFIEQILDNKLPSPQPQEHKLASYCRRFRKRDGLIDINASAMSVYNTVRAFASPYFGAFFYIDEEYITVKKAACEKWSGYEGEAGTVINKGDYGIELACGDGSIMISEIEINSKNFKFDEINNWPKPSVE